MQVANATNDDELRPLSSAIKVVIPGNKNPSTPWRWITRGIAGANGERIKLQVWYVGRSPHTTVNSVRHWLDAVTAARLERTQQRADDVTDDELEAVGLIGGRR